MFWKVVGVLFVVGLIGTALDGGSSVDVPVPTSVSVVVSVVRADTTSSPFDPVGGGSGTVQPVVAPSTSPTISVVSRSAAGSDIDCERAEELADSAEYEAGDIADYCDYGPDDGSELPDEFDWDE